MIEGAPLSLLDAIRRERLDTVEGAFAFAGGSDLDKPGLGHRRRTRVELADGEGGVHRLYLKRYAREPIVAALRRWWRHGRRRSAARTEFDNIRAARAVGVATMEAVGCGEEPCPIGAKRSYLLVTAVPGEAMERCFEAFVEAHPADGQVEAVTRQLARLVRTLHDSGHVHRDLYCSHVFMDESDGRVRLYLIDLARMFAPRLRRFRWYVKDLAQLKYSMPASWMRQHWPAFLSEYLVGVGPGGVRRFGRAIDRKVVRMRRRADRKRSGSGGSQPA